MMDTGERVEDFIRRQHVLNNIEIPVDMGTLLVKALCKEMDTLSWCVDQLDERLHEVEKKGGNNG